MGFHWVSRADDHTFWNVELNRGILVVAVIPVIIVLALTLISASTGLRQDLEWLLPDLEVNPQQRILV